MSLQERCTQDISPIAVRRHGAHAQISPLLSEDIKQPPQHKLEWYSGYRPSGSESKTAGSFVESEVKFPRVS
jgi:hypothetical protein